MSVLDDIDRLIREANEFNDKLHQSWVSVEAVLQPHRANAANIREPSIQMDIYEHPPVVGRGDAIDMIHAAAPPVMASIHNGVGDGNRMLLDEAEASSSRQPTTTTSLLSRTSGVAFPQQAGRRRSGRYGLVYEADASAGSQIGPISAATSSASVVPRDSLSSIGGIRTKLLDFESVMSQSKQPKTVVGIPYASPTQAFRMLQNMPANTPEAEVRRSTVSDAVLKDAMMSLLSKRPKVALRGVHIVVHEMYRPDSDTLYEFVPKDYLYPSQWSTEGGTFHAGTMISNGRRQSMTLGAMKNKYSSEISHWYAKSIGDILSDTTSDSYVSKCYTIDIDPVSYSTKQEEFRAVARRFSNMYGAAKDKNIKDAIINLQDAINVRAFNSFMQMLNKSARNEFDLIDERHSPTAWKYAEVSSRYVSAFVRENSNLLTNAEALDAIVSHAAFRSAVHWFLMNEWANYDAIVTSLGDIKPTTKSMLMSTYRKDYFVEVIGFASVNEWQDSQHDITFAQSRKSAWENWIQTAASSLRDTERHSRLITGIFTRQSYSVPPYAVAGDEVEVDAAYRYENLKPSTTAEDRRSNTFGAMFPAQFTRIDSIAEALKGKYYTKDEIMSFIPNNVLLKSSMGKYQRFIRRSGIGMPKFLTENALNPFVHDTPFKRDEFGWLVDGAMAPVQLGFGGFGQVVKVRYQSSGGGAQWKHHAMVVDMLNIQKEIFQARERIQTNDGNAVNSAVRDYDSKFVPIMVTRIALKSVTGQTEYIDFLQQEKNKLSNQQMIDLHDKAINIVETLTTPSKPGLDTSYVETHLKSLYAGYDADVRIRVAVKFGERYLANRHEYLVSQLCHHSRMTAQYIDVIDKTKKKEIIEWSGENVILQTTISKVNGSVAVNGAFDIEISTEYGNKGDVKFDMKVPEALMRNWKVGSNIKVNLDSLNVMISYGWGYDNQFVFMVMPVAGMGSLHSLLSKVNESESIDVKTRRAAAESDPNTYTDRIKRLGSNNTNLNQRRPLSVIELVSCLSDALSGVRFLNSKGIHHRDIKSANILVDDLRQGYITDFGLAVPYGAALLWQYGTPGIYDSEILDDEDETIYYMDAMEPALDTYAFGMVIDEVLTSKYCRNIEFAQFIGTSANGQDLEALMADPNIGPRKIGAFAIYTDYRPGDAETPHRQRILSEAAVDIFVSTLKMLKENLTNRTWVQRMVASYRADHDINTRQPNEHFVFNRLLAAQIVLNRLRAVLVEDVTANKALPLRSERAATPTNAKSRGVGGFFSKLLSDIMYTGDVGESINV